MNKQSEEELVKKNIDKDIIFCKHSELNRSDDSPFRLICLACEVGTLRDQETLEIIPEDNCIHCGQRYYYTDFDHALTHDGSNDYTLEDGQTSVWITIGGLSIYIIRRDDGVQVDIMPKGSEADGPVLDTAFGAFDNAEGVHEGIDDDDTPEVISTSDGDFIACEQCDALYDEDYNDGYKGFCPKCTDERWESIRSSIPDATEESRETLGAAFANIEGITRTKLDTRVDPTDPWNDDEIQFPRLLAEIKMAGLGNETLQLLKKSMDLSTGEICEILGRAEEAWEAIKGEEEP